MIHRLCILGVGLIGGSLARAARRADACTHIVGSGRDEVQLRRAVELGVIDSYETDAARAVADADVIVLAVPLGAMEAVLRIIAPHCKKSAIITDVGSAKCSVVHAARAVYGEVPARFVPGHPIAGTEKSGVEASFAELFQDRRVILTPLAHTDRAAVEVVRGLWQGAGADVVEMDVDHHDAVLAATSHLPHVLAYALVDALARMEEKTEIFRYAAGGFRDFTRIASSDPVMWRDICVANRAAIAAVLERYVQELKDLTEAVRAGNGDALLEIFMRAKNARDRYCEREGIKKNGRSA